MRTRPAPRLPLIPTPPNNRPFSFAIGKGETLPGPQPVSLLHFPDQMEKQPERSEHTPPQQRQCCFVFSNLSYPGRGRTFFPSSPLTVHTGSSASERERGRTMGKRRGGQEKGRYLISPELLQTLMIQFQSPTDWKHLRNSKPKPLTHMLPTVLTHRNCKK